MFLSIFLFFMIFNANEVPSYSTCLMGVIETGCTTSTISTSSEPLEEGICRDSVLSLMEQYFSLQVLVVLAGLVG
jgi:hypothetical protein